MILPIAVGVAAALGAAARYQVLQHQHDQTFPWGTFVITVTGSLLLGLTLGLATHHGLPPVPTTLIGRRLPRRLHHVVHVLMGVPCAGRGRRSGAGGRQRGRSLAAGLEAAAAGFGLALL